MNIHIKKIFFILTILFVLLFLLPACNKNANDNANTPDNQNESQKENGENTPAEELIGKDDLPEKDFGGKEFIILVNPDPAFRHFYDVCVEGIDGDLMNDAIYKRNLEVEERFHIKIADRQTNNTADSIRKSISSGSVDYSVAWVGVKEYGSLSQQNLFIDLNKIPDLNLEKIYWDKNVDRDFTISGKLYGMMGDLSTSVSIFTHLFGLNRTLAQDNGINISEIYQSVRNGKWTYDKFYSIIKDLYKDIDGDGARNYADQYGLGATPAICDAMFSASGEKLIAKNTNGDFILTPVTDRIESVYAKINDIITNKTITVSSWNVGKVGVETLKGDYGYAVYDKFLDNTVLFVDIDIGMVLDYRQVMDYDFGIVPLPKYEESQTHYSVYAYPFYPLITIPSSYAGDSDSIEFIGMTLEGLASASYRTLTPAFYDTALATKYTRDEESIEMLDIILRSRIYDWMTIFDFGKISSNIWSSVEKDKLNIVSLFEKYSPKAEADIQKLMDAYAENE